MANSKSWEMASEKVFFDVMKWFCREKYQTVITLSYVMTSQLYSI